MSRVGSMSPLWQVVAVGAEIQSVVPRLALTSEKELVRTQATL